MATEFKIPELGEGIESGDITRVAVKEGDSVEKNQTLIEIEAGKASMEIPSPVAGTIKAVHVKVGDTVDVGQLVVEIDEGDDSGEKEEPAEEKPAEKEAVPAEGEQSAEKPEAEKPVEEKPEPAEKPKADADKEKKKPEPEKKEPEPEPDDEKKSEDESEEKALAPEEKEKKDKFKAVSAAPNVRRLARELGVNIHNVPSSDPDGHITKEDVKSFARQTLQNGPATEAKPPAAVRIEKMSAIRKATMKHMAHCWATIPHVTQHDMADITRLEEMRKRYAPKAEAAGAKLTMTAILVKVLSAALKVHPKFNCSIDPEKAEIHYKSRYNIGIAMDTPKGLLVPVITDGDKKNIVELAIELRDLAEKARSGKLTADDFKGGTFTFTNLGGIGGSFFTPIINSPEVAILGTGRAYWEPGIEDGTKHFRLPLSLSYDHRIIDGADGARFLRWIVDTIEEPMLISLQG
ncbi:MAG: hypothetical protein PWQ29_2 [Verrucomicrobiota bacterium]|jgi:pyruvate dehydrogenase E2 component (dihydrolipoamide acetyltransferase)|nr:hypothetical protein [Verrucomicrobiota bacterium]MDK2962608.1 hypothetical protein [Verrucomicrobiota bacterium]